MLKFVCELMTLGTLLVVGLTIISRVVPNGRLRGWGIKSGKFIDGFGSAKIGNKSWEKIEDFLINSIGEYLKGIKIGLNSNDPIENQKEHKNQ